VTLLSRVSSNVGIVNGKEDNILEEWWYVQVVTFSCVCHSSITNINAIVPHMEQVNSLGNIQYT